MGVHRFKGNQANFHINFFVIFIGLRVGSKMLRHSGFIDPQSMQLNKLLFRNLVQWLHTFKGKQ